MRSLWLNIVSDLSGFFSCLFQNVNFNALSMIKWHHSNRHHAKFQVIRVELSQNSILWRHYVQKGVGSISADDPIINKVEKSKSKFQTYMLTLSVFTSQCTWCIGHCFLLLLIAFFSTIRWFQGNISMAWQSIMCLLLSFELVSYVGSVWTQRELSPLYHLLVVKGDYIGEVFKTRPQKPRPSATAVVPRWILLPAQWTAAWMQFFAIAK